MAIPMYSMNAAVLTTMTPPLRIRLVMADGDMVAMVDAAEEATEDVEEEDARLKPSTTMMPVS